MYWLFYFLNTALLSHLIASLKKKYYLFIFVVLLIILLTPSQIEVGSSEYAPAIFNFILNTLFERNFSLRALKPLALSMPLCLIILLIGTTVKKRFF